MKKVIGKNQVIITSLAILIAVAGYLNFADVDLGFRDKEASTDSSSILEDAGYDLTDETALLDENQADGGLTDNSFTDSQEGSLILDALRVTLWRSVRFTITPMFSIAHKSTFVSLTSGIFSI